MARYAVRNLYEKLCDSHTVRKIDEHHVLLYVDRHILNEYTSPQAFNGLRETGREVRRPEYTFAVVDHVNFTKPDLLGREADAEGMEQIRYLRQNCSEFGIELFDLLDFRQGIEHVTIPDQGLIMPSMVVACGDSHTTTYGALGALGIGIGTSEIEHVLATQTLVHRRLKTMRVTIKGELKLGVTPKDLVMALIKRIGAAGAIDHAVEFSGEGFSALSVEGRMTICNMVVEAGARAAVATPDATVFSYLESKPRTPRNNTWPNALIAWSDLRSDPGVRFDREVDLRADMVEPLVTWGTSPEHVIEIGDRVPDPATEQNATKRHAMERALAYMDLRPGTPIESIRIDRAFIGSCTNGRLEDLRDAARIARGRTVAPHVKAVIVPGSREIKLAAEREGLAEIFQAAGFEWHDSGCSMCLAMNGDVLPPGERCASSTNRNFEGRQGQGGRTHLMSPAMAAAAAIAGRFVDVRRLDPKPSR